MFKTLSRYLLLITCSWLLVGPQFFLQIGAWSWMLTAYAQENSFEVAVKETFSGERPCHLCKIIEATDVAAPNKQGDDRNRSDELRLLIIAAPAVVIGGAPPEFALFGTESLQPPDARSAVPTPPPRSSV